jgi:hypothetical protein
MAALYSDAYGRLPTPWPLAAEVENCGADGFALGLFCMLSIHPSRCALAASAGGVPGRSPAVWASVKPSKRWPFFYTVFCFPRWVRRLLFGFFTVPRTTIGRRERRVSKRKRPLPRVPFSPHRWISEERSDLALASFSRFGPCYDDPVTFSGRVNRTVPH